MTVPTKCITRVLTVLVLISGSGCDIFSTRTPEPPIDTQGRFIQPDTPEQVIQNIQNAIQDLNTQNYRRSLGSNFSFQPTATAEARDAIWSGWSQTEEEQYFSTIAASISQSGTQRLELNDQTFTLIDDSRSVLDATYVLVFPHNRSSFPQTVQGRLSWQIERSSDGLWYILNWIDSEIGSESSWSDLKAAFVS
ncbi:MAG: hypothetical protein HKN43_08475 [Rhodothermales bacterium]|nr:hypothetical protein [Rhodothermales bacterium]